MRQKLDDRILQFRGEASNALEIAGSAAKVKVDLAGLMVAETSVAALFVAPGVLDATVGDSLTLAFGYFRSKTRKFKAGFYSIRMRMGSERPLEEVEWIDHSGKISRRTKIWWVDQPPTGNTNKITICSSETRPFPNGSTCQYFDGTIDIRGIEYHFYCYVF